jgi:hypothetical protein
MAACRRSAERNQSLASSSRFALEDFHLRHFFWIEKGWVLRQATLRIEAMGNAKKIIQDPENSLLGR